MEEAALLADGDHGHGVGQALGGGGGALHGVHGDVHLHAPLAQDLANVQHGGLVHLPFADDHRALYGELVQDPAHGLGARLVHGFLIPLARQAACRQGGLFGYPHHLEDQSALDFHVSIIRGWAKLEA